MALDDEAPGAAFLGRTVTEFRAGLVETTLDGIVGVVTNGLFAKRGADVLLLATADGVQTFERT